MDTSMNIDELKQAPTEIEIAQLNDQLSDAGKNILRRLAFQRDTLKQWQCDMVAKTAAQSLDGYRELGAKLAACEAEIDSLRKLVSEKDGQLGMTPCRLNRCAQYAEAQANAVRYAFWKNLVANSHEGAFNLMTLSWFTEHSFKSLIDEGINFGTLGQAIDFYAEQMARGE